MRGTTNIKPRFPQKPQFGSTAPPVTVCSFPARQMEAVFYCASSEGIRSPGNQPNPVQCLCLMHCTSGWVTGWLGGWVCGVKPPPGSRTPLGPGISKILLLLVRQPPPPLAKQNPGLWVAEGGVGFGGERDAPCGHRASFLLFITFHFLDVIVLLCCCPVRCHVAELVPQFTLQACPEDCIVHAIPWSIVQQHNVFVLVRAGTPVFYNHGSAKEQVPTTILGPSQRRSDYLRIQYEVNGKVVIHDADALHHLEFHIWSPSPSPSTSSTPEPDGEHCCSASCIWISTCCTSIIF